VGVWGEGTSVVLLSLMMGAVVQGDRSCALHCPGFHSSRHGRPPFLALRGRPRHYPHVHGLNFQGITHAALSCSFANDGAPTSLQAYSGPARPPPCLPTPCFLPTRTSVECRALVSALTRPFIHAVTGPAMLR
jgi:hypothetical protein